MAKYKLTLTELRKRLTRLKKRGFIQTMRKHDTGIGHTLEQLLGLKENNISIPDLGNFELKAQRIESSSLITLFTKKPDDLPNSNILDKFGYPRPKDSLKVIHQTVRLKQPNRMGFVLKENKKSLSILKDGVYVFSYDKQNLKKAFNRKFAKGVIVVLASRKKNGNETFHFTEAYLLKSGVFADLLKYLYYDIRIGRYPNGNVHDHGSAFRVKKTDLRKIFDTFKRLI